MNASLTRRAFVGTGAALAAGATLPHSSDASVPLGSSRPRPSAPCARNYIHIFLPGGWPATELWDPKPHTPFRPGMRGSELLSTCESIETSAPGIRIGAGLEALAPCMHYATVIRSLVPDADVLPHEAVDHATAQQRMIDALTFDIEGEESLRIPESFRPDYVEFIASHGDAGAWRDHFANFISKATCAVDTGQSGMRFRRLRVTLPFRPFQHFDSHESGSKTAMEMKRTVLRLISAMVGDLSCYGLDDTIICISSEFSRTIAGVPPRGCEVHTGQNTIIKDERDYGLHQHFAASNSLVLFGGPFQGGHVIGRTRDRHPMTVVEQPVTLSQVRQMIAGALV